MKTPSAAPERIAEMVSKFETMEYDDFEEWVLAQPDADELSKAFLGLLRTQPPSAD